METAEFTATAPLPDRLGRLLVRHDERKLIGMAEVVAGPAKPVDFKLEPWGALTGRLLDAVSKPIAGEKVRDTIRLGTHFTGATGKFMIDGFVPETAYEIRFREMKPKGWSGLVT